MEYYTGIDLHKHFVLLTTLDSDGNVVKQRRLHNDEELIARYFDALPGIHYATVESCVGWYWLRDLLESISVQLTMGHPLYIKAIAWAKVKTDTVDSAMLAKLLRGGLIPEAYMISHDRRGLRDLTRRRHRLIDERTRMFNAAQGVLQAVNCSSVEDLEQWDRINYESLTAIAEKLDQQISVIEKEVTQAMRDDPEYLLVQTIPGVGPIHAAEIVLETDTITRFADESKYFSYTRVVPGSHNSGNRTATKHSKQGSVHLRRVFGDAAVHAVSQHPEFEKLFKQLHKGKEGQTWALVAKEIARGVFHVLSKREPYYGPKGKRLMRRKANEPVLLRRARAASNGRSEATLQQAAAAPDNRTSAARETRRHQP